MRTFPARYRSVCLPCGETIEPGEEITAFPGVGYIHLDCVDRADEEPPESPAERREPMVREREVMPRGKTVRDRCDNCFIVHTPGQVGCE